MMKKLFCLSILVGLVVMAAGLAVADVPKVITIQAKITDNAGAAVVNSDIAGTFKVYAAPSGGTSLFDLPFYGVRTDANGIVNIPLNLAGYPTMDFTKAYYFSVILDKPAGGGESSARQQLTAAPYAVTAQNVYGGTGFFGGNVGIGTKGAPADKLEISDAASGVGSLRLSHYTEPKSYYARQYFNVDGSGTATGNGTYLAFQVRTWRAGLNAGQFIDGTPMVLTGLGRVGIGTTAPSNDLELANSGIGKGITISSTGTNAPGLALSNSGGSFGLLGLSLAPHHWVDNSVAGDTVLLATGRLLLQTGGNAGVTPAAMIIGADRNVSVRGTVTADKFVLSNGTQLGGSMPFGGDPSGSGAQGAYIGWNVLSAAGWGETDFINSRGSAAADKGGFAFMDMASTAGAKKTPLMYLNSKGLLSIFGAEKDAGFTGLGLAAIGSTWVVGIGTDPSKGYWYDFSNDLGTTHQLYFDGNGYGTSANPAGKWVVPSAGVEIGGTVTAADFRKADGSSLGGMPFAGDPSAVGAQGAYIGWNNLSTNGYGETDFINNHGGADANHGGFAFMDVAPGAGQPKATLMYLSQKGMGVGTTAPAEKLSVNGNLFLNTAADAGLRIQNGGGKSFWISSPNGDMLSIGGRGATLPELGAINVSGTGNVGIGLGGAGRVLDVYGRARLRPGNENYSAGIWLTGNDGVENVFTGLQGPGGTDNWGVFSGGGWRLTVTNAGNLGIGTAAPKYKLDVSDRIRLNSGPGGSAGLWLNNESLDKPAGNAFIGMYDANHVGFFGSANAARGGSETGWGLLVNTNTNRVLIGASPNHNWARNSLDISVGTIPNEMHGVRLSHFNEPNNYWGQMCLNVNGSGNADLTYLGFQVMSWPNAAGVTGMTITGAGNVNIAGATTLGNADSPIKVKTIEIPFNGTSFTSQTLTAHGNVKYNTYLRVLTPSVSGFPAGKSIFLISATAVGGATDPANIVGSWSQPYNNCTASYEKATGSISVYVLRTINYSSSDVEYFGFPNFVRIVIVYRD